MNGLLLDLVLVAVGLVLTVGTGYFVAAEFALVNLDRNELENRQRDGEGGLAPTIAALRITSTHLSGAQLGITLTTLLTGFTFEPAISRMLAGPLTGLGVPDGAVDVVGPVVGIALATLLSMVVGELVPKNFAIAVPRATAKLVMGFQTLFTTVFKPLILLCNNTANAIIRSMGVEPQEELSGARTAEELGYLVRRSATEGVLDEDPATLLDRTLRFSRHDAADVMTPRVKMVRLDLTATAADVLTTALRTGLSRFPVIGEDVDDVRGVVHVKQAYALAADVRPQTPVADLMVEALQVPDSLGVDLLLAELRAGNLQCGIVTDEYGGTAGLVTLEDVVEELVGELRDEHDRSRPGVIRYGRATVFDAGWRPDEVLDRTGVVVPEGDAYETVGGFVTEELGHLAEVGDEVVLEHGVLRVERMDGTRVDRIRYTPAEPETAADGETPSGVSAAPAKGADDHG